MSKAQRNRTVCGGVWSAAPTPFTAGMEIDREAVRCMVEHHARLGVKGLFLAGTNGEGPWMTDAQRRTLVRAVTRSARRRFQIAVQVTDNSAARILDNIRAAAKDGADLAVIAPPNMPPPRTVPASLLNVYQNAIRHSPLPVGIYDRPMASGGFVPDNVMAAVLAEKNVVMLKDSSGDPGRMRRALAAKRRRPDLTLLNGCEFNCLPYLKAGYDGLLLGGGVFNGYLAGQIMAATDAGQWDRAEELQQRMNRMMWNVYGGRKIACWLAGEKYLLMRLGLFRTFQNYPGYPLSAACRRSIERVLREDGEFLLP